jgi:RNA-directed DNA polymerase
MTTARSQSVELFRLADVKTTVQLARALGVPLQILQEVIACEDPRQIYAMHSIPKRNPRNAYDYRIVWESREESVARSHKAVARRLDDFARQRNISYPHPAVHGYVRGGSTRCNAQPHCGARVVVRADIQNFFPNITLERIETMLRALGMQAVPAQALARFVTIDGALPLGLPESPVISNLVCLDLDTDLQSLAEGLGVSYTRYADDMTFSGDANPPRKEQMRATLEKHGFALSERKFKMSKRGQAHFVTGLSVSEKDYPHVPRKLKHLLRMELHFCERFGIDLHALKSREDSRKTFLRLAGMVKYVAFIERRKSAGLIAQWDRILSAYLGPNQYAEIKDRDHGDRFIVADETEFNISGINYLAICFVRFTSLDSMELFIDSLLVDYLTRPGAKGNLESLKKVGIHYTDAHPDLRTLVLGHMTDFLVWSASIQFARLDSPDRYKEIYLRLFTNLIRQEFLTSNDWNVEILVERNDKIKIPPLTHIVETEYRRSEAEGGRRPATLPSIRSVEKASTRSITLPDFALATFRSYAQLVPNESVLDFERIRDRVRYVHDADRGIYYARKRPFVAVGSE